MVLYTTAQSTYRSADISRSAMLHSYCTLQDTPRRTCQATAGTKTVLVIGKMADASSDNSLRFRSEHKDVEDRLKAQSTRLLQLSDYRKRRAEVLQDAPLAPGPNCPVDL